MTCPPLRTMSYLAAAWALAGDDASAWKISDVERNSLLFMAWCLLSAFPGSTWNPALLLCAPVFEESIHRRSCFSRAAIPAGAANRDSQVRGGNGIHNQVPRPHARTGDLST